MTQLDSSRALFFLQRGRFPEAEQEVRRLLVEDPGSSTALSLLSICLRGQEKVDEALEEAQAAVGQDPTDPFAHLTMGKALACCEQLDKAVAAVEESIRLDPDAPGSHGFLAQLKLAQRLWPEALEAAERGLAIEPEHGTCATARAAALSRLGRSQDAIETMEARLRTDPEDADAHESIGWAHLEADRHQEALLSFQEALRLDPSLDGARRGMLEALKARYLVYRWFLRYAMRMARLGGDKQWLIILGGYLGYQVLRNVAESNPALQPFVWPLLGLYLAFALFSWTAPSIFNLLLSLNRFGRMSLDEDQRRGAFCVGVCALLAIASGVLGVVWPPFPGLGAALGFVVLMLPVSSVYLFPKGPRTVMTAITLALLVLGAEAIALGTTAPFIAEEELQRRVGGAGFFFALVFFVAVGVASFLGNLLLSPRFTLPLARGREERELAFKGMWRLLAVATLVVGVPVLLTLVRLLTSQGAKPATLIRIALTCGLFYALFVGQSWARWVLALLLFLAGGLTGTMGAMGDPLELAIAAPLATLQLGSALWLVGARSLPAYLGLRSRPRAE